VAAVLQGAPTVTFDLDVVHSTDPANVIRLMKALKALQALDRFQRHKRLKPAASHLTSPGHQLLMACFGPLDLLGRIGNGRAYADLLPNSVRIPVARNLLVRVLGLKALIEVKLETAGEKDLAALPVLRRTLEIREKGRRGGR
jgi:hypothetical protein